MRDYTCVDSSPITWPDLPRQNIKICVRRASVLIWFVVAKLTHGPIVGATSSNSVVIWARADVKARFKVQLDSGTSKAVALNGENDFTGVVRFNRLQPDRPYTYSVSLGGEQVAGGDEYSFKTFPKSGSGDFSFAFGSCFVPDDYGDQIFQSLAEKADDWKLRFFLMLGDNVYVDHYVEHTRTKLGLKPADNLLQLYREAYRHSWKFKSFRRFLRRMSTFMIRRFNYQVQL